MDHTGRDAVTPGGFAPAPGEAPAKVDLEAQSDLDFADRADPNRQTFASPAKGAPESEKSATKAEEDRPSDLKAEEDGLVESNSKV